MNIEIVILRTQFWTELLETYIEIYGLYNICLTCPPVNDLSNRTFVAIIFIGLDVISPGGYVSDILYR